MSDPSTVTRVQGVLTGFRPAGALHVGHWAGNVENMLALQEDPRYECFLFIADWHMLTTPPFRGRRERMGPIAQATLATVRDATHLRER